MRLNNFKHTKKNEDWQKIFHKQYLQERILTEAFHSGESSMNKSLAQMNQLKSTPHPGHDGIS
ncbi:MAG: hypothetical protein VX662_09685, partial [SAR324 cluster bacterium]|nr:hypothetical protein [SAR324 cluster bacterium]